MESGPVSRSTTSDVDDTPKNVLSANEWRRVDQSVDRALTFLAAQQQPDGSFPSTANAQPGVTSLCLLAFMAHGHNPGHGPYGDRLDRAVKYILDCQKKNGLLMLVGEDEPQVNRDIEHEVGSTGTYDHAISSLALCELYGMNPSRNAAHMKKAIEKALRVTLEMQHWPKDIPDDEGGWRYINDYDQTDSDLSVTGWHLMFLRSARNAGFNVPDQTIADAVAYVRRAFQPILWHVHLRDQARRHPQPRHDGRGNSRARPCRLSQLHRSQAGRRRCLGYSFDVYNSNGGFKRDRYHYSLFMCCQGMYQMGSPYWEQFFPRTVAAVLAHQQANGSWNAESDQRDRRYGNSYTTALVVLSLGAPNQLLPIFQR